MGRLGRFSYDRVVTPETRQEFGITDLRQPLWYASRTATSKAMRFYQHVKVRRLASVDTVNLGGSTGSFNRIWGGFMFTPLSTVSVSVTAFTFMGATLFVPADIAIPGWEVNFILFGSR